MGGTIKRPPRRLVYSTDNTMTYEYSNDEEFKKHTKELLPHWIVIHENFIENYGFYIIKYERTSERWYTRKEY